MDTPHLPYPLDLGDGREPIMCRDAHQAQLLHGVWTAYRYGVARDEIPLLPLSVSGDLRYRSDHGNQDRD